MRCSLAAALALLPLVPRAGGQSASTESSIVTLNVRGQVVDAQSGAPVPRALVSLGTRAVLTDALGRFEFPQFAGAQAQARVTKPGYVQTLDGQLGPAQNVPDLTVPLTLRIHRDALITGLITGSDRLPLPRVQVQIYRDLGEDQDHRSLPVAVSTTDSHGVYRSEQPPGRYRVSLRYAPRATPEGLTLLPVDYPEQAAGEVPSTFKLDPGQERRVDLQARTSESFPVTLHTDLGDVRGNLRLTARTAAGTAFAVFARSTDTSGEYRTELPSGTYRLQGVLQNAGQNKAQPLEGETRVTVQGKPVSGVSLHLAEVPLLPVELIAEASTDASAPSASATGTMPNLLSFNLRLQNSEAQVDFGGNEVTVLAQANQTFAMQAGPGVYRLRGHANGTWFVRSASYGTTDLLTQPLVVAPGSGGVPIRVVVSNAAGQLSGTVTAAGAPVQGVVYLEAREPSLTPLRSVRSGSDGSYSATLPPGNYTVVAFDQAFTGDLLSPEIAGKLAGAAQPIEVTSGAKARADLTAVSAESLQ